ncbi:MAG TPA: condensation domain-containing protein, partial [Ktedonosporobacter sp.]|nr:condensation domain-containing protein [Ktedonosporobacter sp.]
MKLKNVEDVYILGPMQQGILFHMLYESQPDVYFSQFVCTIDQPLDAAIFRQAWQHMLVRHSILRTAFLWDGLEEPLQIVNQHVALPWEQWDWRDMSVAEQETRLATFLAADRARGFDLAVAPLLRLYLIQTAEDHYTFISSSPHLVMDGWSRALLLQEVSTCYSAYAHGEALRLPRVRPYRDYIGWLQRQDSIRAKDFWQEVLKGFMTPTMPGRVPIKNRSQENGQQPCYSRSELHLSASLTTALQTFTRQQQLTMNTLLQGAWALLLSRYSGEQDILFGVTVAGRPTSLSSAEKMVGLFINTLPLRIEVQQGAHLLSWLKCLQEQQIAMLEYQYTPLSHIQSWSEISREQPLFESILVFENTLSAVSWEQTNGVQFQNMRGGVEHTNYPLTLTVGPDNQLLLRLTYDTDRFEPETIMGILNHLSNLLKDMLAHASDRLADLSILSVDERRKICYEWNQVQQNYPTEHCIHEFFQQQVFRSADTVAVVYAEEQISYQALDRLSTGLAHRLHFLGMQPEERIGLCLEPGVAMVVALLAVLKAGATYVPLDPSAPQARLAFLLQDASISLLLTQHSLLPLFPLTAVTALCLDSDWETIAAMPATPLPSAGHPAQAAYLLYTSGSTGQPKGVLVE